jgi:hypothetical protein
MAEVRCAVDIRAFVGESPVWDEHGQALRLSRGQTPVDNLNRSRQLFWALTNGKALAS